ncbi:phosphotransferase [Mycobacterium sp. NPDC006124]|uniref:phosphotransferase n=1 Tax=Mycobacterium sp. NPDC006124 TaxID=3156729 RepID=UPI0033B41C9F
MSFSLSDSELHDRLDRLPVLAGRERVVEDLVGGLTNRNVKVTTADGVYVARCSGSDPELLAIDRDDEYFNSCAAEQAGVGAPVVDYRPDLGILLIGYLDGVTLTAADFARDDVIARAAVACRTLHDGPRFRNDFDMFARQAAYLRIVETHGFRLPDGYLEFADQFAAIRKVLNRPHPVTVPCNNDLLAANFVDDGGKIWLIDYEYSGNNDPCFELGNIWRDNGLSLDQLEALVTAYYGRTTGPEVARARLQGTVSQYGWTLWGCIQDGSSAMDFDFWEWAMERYENAVEEFRGRDFARLLDDAAAAGRDMGETM